MRNLLLIGTILIVVSSRAQDNFVANGIITVVKPSTYMVVEGNVQLNSGSELRNEGTIDFTNNWTNNAGNTGLTNLLPGEVIMSGDAQLIQGTDMTQFYKLTLQGSGSIKEMLVDADVANSLDLTASILETNNNTMHLQSTAVNSLSWSTGYISSNTLGGFFNRSTKASSPYPFPVGSSNLTNPKRVVEVIPTTVDSSVFGVRLAGVDPSNESGVSFTGANAPFNRTSIVGNIEEINDKFFHNIYRFYGVAEANAKIYYFDSDPTGVFISMAKWNTSSQNWEDDNFSIQNVGTALPEYGTPQKVAISNENLIYNSDIYALDGINLFVPTGFSPNNDGFNDAFEILHLDTYPENELQIFNRWGERVFYAKPYLNDWTGINTSKGIKLMGNQVAEDTYFYVLILNSTLPPIKGYLELRID